VTILFAPCLFLFSTLLPVTAPVFRRISLSWGGLPVQLLAQALGMWNTLYRAMYGNSQMAIMPLFPDSETVHADMWRGSQQG
jgi:hypothetical protein